MCPSKSGLCICAYVWISANEVLIMVTVCLSSKPGALSCVCVCCFISLVPHLIFSATCLFIWMRRGPSIPEQQTWILNRIQMSSSTGKPTPSLINFLSFPHLSPLSSLPPIMSSPVSVWVASLHCVHLLFAFNLSPSDSSSIQTEHISHHFLIFVELNCVKSVCYVRY